MKILFSPSQTKRPGGDLPPVDPDRFFFSDAEVRPRILEAYVAMTAQADAGTLARFFETSRDDKIAAYRSGLTERPAMKAVLRYDGIAYDALDYPSLPGAAQRMIDTHVVIFSDLFGPVLAHEPLPDYLMKQGARIDGISPEKLYKSALSGLIDTWIAHEEVIDLRAGHYEKFYTLGVPSLTYRFLKGGKAVSHYAKAYRGAVLRHIALAGHTTVDQVRTMPIPGLRLKEIVHRGLVEELVMEVTA